jgi:dethiobiotin synthetase
MPGLVITGTDTGVGKTYVTSALARFWTRAGRRVGVLKPIATGAARVGGRLVSTDGLVLIEAVGGGVPLEAVVPLVFEAPLAPSVAARRTCGPLHLRVILEKTHECLDWWSEHAEGVLIEGIGGFLCPIAEDATFADLAIALDYPVLVVARSGLGTLNHTLLTIEAVRARALRIAGIILNSTEPGDDESATTNPFELSRWLFGIGPLVRLCYTEKAARPEAAFEGLDWQALLGSPRRG